MNNKKNKMVSKIIVSIIMIVASVVLGIGFEHMYIHYITGAVTTIILCIGALVGIDFDL